MVLSLLDDISARQWIKVGDIFKLNDFNCAIPPRSKKKDNILCEIQLNPPPSDRIDMVSTKLEV